MRPNGQRISGERRAEGDERVRCMRVLGATVASRLADLRAANRPSAGPIEDRQVPQEYLSPEHLSRFERPHHGESTESIQTRQSSVPRAAAAR